MKKKPINTFFKDYYFIGISLFSFIFWIVSFLYIYGFYSYFGIPITEVSITFLQFLDAFFKTSGIVILFFLGIYFFSLNFKNNLLTSNFLGYFILYFFMFSFSLKFITMEVKFYQHSNLFLSIYILFFLWSIIPIVFGKKLQKLNQEIPHNNLIDIKIMLLFIILIFLFFLVFIFRYGQFSALEKKKFEVLSYENEQFILFNQGDYYLGKKINGEYEIGNRKTLEVSPGNYFFYKRDLLGEPIITMDINFSTINLNTLIE